ncbi:hypothetical protein CLTEP_00730 [Clostridium tepidiprofundi DSM 19306]|uniref:Uncharacterized protein n=1 Tax=Clostridium tepidiprofundi DSM 19306 TaxID=1121338 RepID=A0A151B7B2_9CLOT|nr:hypothetical protein [Clostridium tepidiprofundi]KYH35680.1 hypothetical protein CLTEP_00730 [Clostridium tepidiprofundi DSM 19306]
MNNIDFFPEWYINKIHKRNNFILNIICLIFFILNICLIFKLMTNISIINALDNNIQLLKKNERSCKKLNNITSYCTINTTKYLMSLNISENNIDRINISGNDIKLCLHVNSYDEYKEMVKRLENLCKAKLKYVTPLIDVDNNNCFEVVLVKNDKN